MTPHKLKPGVTYQAGVSHDPARPGLRERRTVLRVEPKRVAYCSNNGPLGDCIKACSQRRFFQWAGKRISA